jgi:predicted dehydrogenase
MYSFVSKGWARRAKAVLSEGNLGDLLAVHADWFFAKGRPVREGLGATGSANLRKGHQPEVPPSQFTFHDSKAEFYAVGVYALGLVTWLAGRRVKSVYGFTRNYFFAEHQKNGQEDFGAFALTLEDGVRATVTGGRTGWSSHPGSGVNHLYVQGTMGNLRADGNAPRIECYTDQSPWRPPEIHPDDPMGFWKSTQQAVGVEPKGNWLPLDVEANERNDVSRFIDRLETGRNGEIDARAASHLTKVILAAYQSTATGEVVEVD